MVDATRSTVRKRRWTIAALILLLVGANGLGVAAGAPASAAERTTLAGFRTLVPVVTRQSSITNVVGEPIPSPTRATATPSPQTPTATATPNPQTPTATRSRFAVAVGAADSEAAIANVLTQTNVGSWFTYQAPTNWGPAGRAMLLRTGSNVLPASYDATLAAVAAARPGSHWIVGNEPNVPKQDWRDDLDLAGNAAAYVAALRHYRTVILGADPTARFVIGNTLNIDANCAGCGGGYVSGRSFMEAVRLAQGAFPPDTVWGIHAYRIDWNRLPMVDTAEPTRELQAFRSYVDSVPGQAGRPIWLTEFGVIWGYSQWCSDGVKVGNCGSAFAADAVDGYLSTMTAWLTSNSSRIGIEKWFLFVSYGQPEPWATVFGGLSIMDGSGASAGLSRYGRTYASYVTS